MRHTLALLLTAVTAALVPVAARAQALQEGETRLRGAVQSIDLAAKKLVILANQYTRFPEGDPKGTGKIDPPRPKTVLVGEATRFRVAIGGAEVSLTPAEKSLEDVPKRTRALTVVGKDQGPGKPMAARLIYWPMDEQGAEATPAPTEPAPAAGEAKPAAGEPEVPTGPIEDGRISHWCAINPMTNRLYVSNMATANVSVIDTKNLRVIATIRVGKRPECVALNPETNRIYVPCALDDKLYVIDGATYKVIARVDVDQGPCGVAVNPKTKRIYVANRVSNSVSVIDAENHTLLATVPVPDTPTCVAVSAALDRVYVTRNTAHRIAAIDGKTNTLLGDSDRLGFRPIGVRVDPGGQAVYVLSCANNCVNVLNAVTARPMLMMTGPGGPMDLVADYTRKHTYVSCLNSNSVWFFDLGTQRPIGSVQVAEKPVGLALDETAGRLFVACRDANTVVVVDVNTQQRVGQINVAPTPGGDWPGNLPTD